MWKVAIPNFQRLFAIFFAVLICKVTLSVLFEYRNYLPPNFNSEFLRGRESYFWGAYRWAFYTHLVSGPLALVLGTLLVSDHFRRAVPAWHRRLGRLQVANVLLLMVPSGLWMACYAASGAVAGAGLAALAIATATCITLGWRTAVKKQFGVHRTWMLRTYLLLCSAVVIRIVGGLATVTQYDGLWVYPVSCWGSWLLPWLIFETHRFFQSRQATYGRASVTI